jgi:hypothetical protein
MSAFDAGSLSVENLEGKIRHALGLPEWPSESARPAVAPETDSSGTLRQLRQELAALQRAAAAIGQVPQGYPRHLDLIMRAISALLPWYTRPLREWAENTSRVSQLMFNVVAELIGHLDHFEARGTPPAAYEAPHPDQRS